jgi:hypothetical protein
MRRKGRFRRIASGRNGVAPCKPSIIPAFAGRFPTPDRYRSGHLAQQRARFGLERVLRLIHHFLE